MRRFHIFEFTDQKWFPNILRNCMTEYLEFIIEKSNAYEPLIPFLQKEISKSESNQIIDLGSGSGGGMRWIFHRMMKENNPVKITLTDLYPAIESYENNKEKLDQVKYYPVSVDPSNVPFELKGMRTLFNLFHHLRPADAIKVLQNACESKNSILIVEANDPGPLQFIFMILFLPLLVLLTAPFIKPYRVSRYIFTYLIPVLPFLIQWDGIVSLLRTYSPEQMKDLALQSGCGSYIWESGKLTKGGISLLYMFGTS